jgi:glycosyltransferase involved in cell wall biosynthesis
MAPSPVVSVIMAVRDGQQWLREAVDSILAQTFSDFEFLIIDDGSRDETPRILEAYRARDPRLRVISQPREGVVRFLNSALAQANGALIARIDADDVAMPERLEREVRYLEGHPDVVLLGTWTQLIDEKGRPGRCLRPPTDVETLARMLPVKNPLVSSSIMFRGAAARAVSGYRFALATTSGQGAEDYDLWLRLSEVGTVAILPAVLTQHRRHGSNFTTTQPIQQIFFARLARLSSAARRSTGRDPCSALSAPPDWRAADGSAFYADDARLCRVLELADRSVADAATPSSIELEVISRRLAELTHAEKKLAQLAIVNLLRARRSVPGYSRSALLSLIFRLDSARAVRLIWRTL